MHPIGALRVYMRVRGTHFRLHRFPCGITIKSGAVQLHTRVITIQSTRAKFHKLASLSKRDATMVVVLRVTRAQTASTSGYRFENTESTGQWLPIVLFSKSAVITKCLGIHLGNWAG